jgi:hypothetical protein
MTIDGYFSRNTKKAGGGICAWDNKPTLVKKTGKFRGRNIYGKENPLYETPVFKMTEESFLEEFGKELLPKCGECDSVEFET